MRKMVAAILTADGYRVCAAAPPVETRSLSKNATQPIHLFIATLAKPDAGVVALALLSRHAETRILDAGPTDAKHQLSELPAKQLSRLPKPFALGQLLKASRQLLDT